MSDPLRVVVGYDPTEKPGTFAFMESVLEHASKPVSFTILRQDVLRRDSCYWKDRTDDEATEFSRSRFLAPYLVNYKGPVLFADGADMICKADIAELFDTVPVGYDCAVVKHDYRPKNSSKFGNYNAPQSAYPRKLWSSLMLFWANTAACQRLTPKAVNEKSGAYLHQLKWISPNWQPGETVETDDERIAKRVYSLPEKWNWVPGHSESRVSFEDAAIVHWTEGTPAQGVKVPYQGLWENYHFAAARITA